MKCQLVLVVHVPRYQVIHSKITLHCTIFSYDHENTCTLFVLIIYLSYFPISIKGMTNQTFDDEESVRSRGSSSKKYQPQPSQVDESLFGKKGNRGKTLLNSGKRTMETSNPSIVLSSNELGKWKKYLNHKTNNSNFLYLKT